ncbi:hypothetical protein Vadar_010498 [Vaccinium darrowii]|uniref:Uncharacterized protein n=1 Tax=Vaccinium darrowii TaxID=229202 RepID=A0ACB7YKV2_9ERIC|nr:hypothetical protein Vadar_010498 [Vaccinium darrowii]
MTMLDSSSTAESSMDDGTGSNSHNHHQTPTKPSSLNTAAATTTNDARSRLGGGELEDNDVDRDNFAEDGGGEVWGAFTENFREVQSVLDRNRVLIQQVNENHRSKNHSNLVKNVALIQEINGNISKVVSLYSDLSSNFSSVFHSRDGGPQT